MTYKELQEKYNTLRVDYKNQEKIFDSTPIGSVEFLEAKSKLQNIMNEISDLVDIMKQMELRVEMYS